MGIHPHSRVPQLQNRVRVETQWLWAFLTGQRSSRLISEVPKIARDRSVAAEATH